MTPGNVISTGRDPKSCLKRVFNFELVTTQERKCTAWSFLKLKTLPKFHPDDDSRGAIYDRLQLSMFIPSAFKSFWHNTHQHQCRLMFFSLGLRQHCNKSCRKKFNKTFFLLTVLL